MEYWTINVFVRLDSGKISPDEMCVSAGAQLVPVSEGAYLANQALAEEFMEVCHKVLMKHFTLGYAATLAYHQVGMPSKMLIGKVRMDSQRASMFTSAMAQRAA